MKRIRLTTDWGDYAQGSTLRVLGPQDDIRGQCVDAAKAATLLDLGIAEDPDAKQPRKPRKKAPTRKKAATKKKSARTRRKTK